MDKIQKTVSAVFTVKTFAYKFAVSKDNQHSLAVEFNSRYPKFLDETPPEVKADIDNGAFMRYAENNADKQGYFILKDNDYIRVEKVLFDDTKADKVHLTVAYVTEMTSQAFGGLKSSNPKLHALIKPLRDDSLKYARTIISDIKKKIREIQNIGKTSTRNKATDFDIHVKDTLDDLIKRCTNAISRGDATANKTKLSEAVRAFKLAYFGAGYKAKVQE